MRTYKKVGLILLVLVFLSSCAAVEMEPQRAESGEWLVLESGKCMSDLPGTIEARACRKGDVCMTRKDFEQLMDVIFAKCN